MATDLSQDSVLQYLRNGGGSVKNSELLQHYRNFIRDHADRDRNREIFKKFVNSVATVQQLDGVSYVVLRRKFRGRVPPGGGERGSPGPLRDPAGRNTEPSPERDRVSPAGRAEKPRQIAQSKEVTTPAPPGGSAKKTILPAAGIILNNNNNTVETNLNLKQVTRPPEKTPSLSEPHAQEQHTKVGQPKLGPGPPPGVTPVVRYSQQVPEPPRGREAYLQPRGGLHQVPPLHHISVHQEPPLHHANLHSQVALQHRGGLHREPPLHHIGVHQEPPLHHVGVHPQVTLQPGGGLHQVPPLHHFNLHSQVALQPRGGLYREPPLHHISVHQKPPLHHVGVHPQVTLQPGGGLHQVPPLHHVNPHSQVTLQPKGLHQEPPLHHMSLHPQVALQPGGGRHQELPLHHASLHQEPLLHHVNLNPQVALQPERGFHQESPLHHVNVHPQKVLQPEGDPHQETPLHHANLHQEPPLHHVSVHPQVALQPEGGPHRENPLHHVNRQPQVALQPEGEPPQEPSLHDVSLHPQVALQPEGGLHQEPPLHDVSLHPQVALQPEGGLHQEPPLHHASLQGAPRRVRHRQSYKSAVSYDDDEEEEEEEVPVRRGSAGGVWPLSTPLGDVSRVISASSPCIIDLPAPPSVVSASSSSSSSEKKLPQIYIQDVEREKLPPGGLESGAVGQRGQWAGPGLEPGSDPGKSSRCSLPLEAEHYRESPELHDHTDRRYSQPAGVQLGPRQRDQSQRARLSSSHSSVFSPSSDAGHSSSDWPPPASPRGSGWNSSHEDLQATKGKTEGGSKIQEALQRAQRTRLESETQRANSKNTVPWHHSTGHLHDKQESLARLSPFHHSTGHLHDDQEPTAHVLPRHLSAGNLYDDREEAESSDGSTSSPPVRQRPSVARRLSSQLRSRMCRSLGADLDQLLEEEARAGGGSEAARLNRLHLISSSLSLRYNLSSSSLSSCSTPPRCHSLADLVEGVEGKEGRRSLPTASSSAHHEGPSRQSLVPLEPKEHAWLVKGAAGAWPDIYSLFREDSSLLNRQDFISGFTVLHWIAKHGDHRVLNTLWYGVQKAGLTFDINARSTCGHTPLHIAAMHGHKNIMRLLVNKFNADVKLRDTAGKKPWQYLSRAAPADVFQLLGAPSRAAGRAEGGVGKVDSTWKPEQHHRRRRRHHFSSASSGERPLTISGTTRVKRSSSIAAFLKHKSLLRFQGHQSDSSI